MWVQVPLVALLQGLVALVPGGSRVTFFAILRSIPDKLGGVSAILVLLTLPVINSSDIRSNNFRPFFRVAYWFLCSNFFLLGMFLTILYFFWY